MEPKKAHTVKRPNSHNRAARRRRTNRDRMFFMDVLLRRIKYLGSRKAKRAELRLKPKRVSLAEYLP